MPCKCLPGAPCAPGCSAPGPKFAPPALTKAVPTSPPPGAGLAAAWAPSNTFTSAPTPPASPGPAFLASTSPSQTGIVPSGAGGASGPSFVGELNAPSAPFNGSGPAGEVAPDSRKPWGPTGCPPSLNCQSTVCRTYGCHQDLSTCKTALGPAPTSFFSGGPWLECRGGASQIVYPRPAPWTDKGKDVYRPPTLPTAPSPPGGIFTPVEPAAGGRPADFGKSKYPLVPPPKQEGVVWPGAPDYLYIQIETDPCAPGNDPPTPEAPVGYTYTGVRVTRRRRVVCPHAVYAGLGAYAFVFQYIDTLLLAAGASGGAADGLPGGVPPRVDVGNGAGDDTSTEVDCDKELWLGFFFEGSRGRGDPPFKKSTVIALHSAYAVEAARYGAVAHRFYANFEAYVPDQRQQKEFQINFENAIAWFFAKVCPYLDAGCDDRKIRIDIFGWSRGAIMAMCIAGSLAVRVANCKRGAHRGFDVRFMGLIDPCDSALWHDAAFSVMLGATSASYPGDVDNLDARDYSLPSNVANLFVASASVRSNPTTDDAWVRRFGWALFRSDHVIPHPSTKLRSKATGSYYDSTHENIGFYWTSQAAMSVLEDISTAFASVARETSGARSVK